VLETAGFDFIDADVDRRCRMYFDGTHTPTRILEYSSKQNITDTMLVKRLMSYMTRDKHIGVFPLNTIVIMTTALMSELTQSSMLTVAFLMALYTRSSLFLPLPLSILVELLAVEFREAEEAFRTTSVLLL